MFLKGMKKMWGMEIFRQERKVERRWTKFSKGLAFVQSPDSTLHKWIVKIAVGRLG